MRQKIHLVPFDIEAGFDFSTWKFWMKFSGCKGKDGEGADIDVVIHMTPSWISYICSKLQEVTLKVEEELADIRKALNKAG